MSRVAILYALGSKKKGIRKEKKKIQKIIIFSYLSLFFKRKLGIIKISKKFILYK